MKSLFTSILLTLSAPTFAQIPSYVPSNGLVGWWPFNGNANDESGNGNDGTVNGATLTTDRFGVADKAYNFSANNNNSIGIGSLNLTADFTINTWYKLNSIGGWQNIISKYGPSGGYALIFDPNGALYSHTNGGTGFGNVCASNYVESSNNWHMVTLRLSQGVLKFFIDGVEHGSCSNMNNSAQNNSITYFGRQSNGTSENLNGILDDVGIWDRSLSDVEILALYQACQTTITLQPQSQNIATSAGTASFNTASSSATAIYQWQTNLGLGFQNLSNAGQYSGSTSATLTVSSLSMSNNNQVFRCVINESGCTDTTSEAILTIINDASVQSNTPTTFKLYPNPVKDELFIKGVTEAVLPFEVYSTDGKKVLSGTTSGAIDVNALKKGSYQLKLKEQTMPFVKQ